jgi:hypothetical protein
MDRAAANRRSGGNRIVYCQRIQFLTVTGRAEIAHIKIGSRPSCSYNKDYTTGSL